MLKFKFQFDPRIKEQLATQKKPLFMGLFCNGLSTLLSALLIPYIKIIMNIIETKQIERLNICCLGILALFGIKYWFTRGQIYFLSQSEIQLTAILRKKLFDKLNRLPIRYFNTQKSGVLQSILSHDVGIYQNAILTVKTSIEGPMKGIFGFFMIFHIQWKLALISLLLIPIMAVVIQRNKKKLKNAQRVVQSNLGQITSTTQELILGMRVIKAFRAEKQFAARYGHEIEATELSQLDAAHKTAALRPLVELIGAAALSMAVFVCGQLVYHHQLTIGDMAAFVFGLDFINQGARSMGNLNQTLAQLQAATERIYDEILDIPECKTLSKSNSTLPKVSGKLEFENVSFTYPDGTKALENISFILEPGKSLALVGPSGAGKSTLSDLVLRYGEPTEGRILFEGVDIQELDIDWYRQQVSIVPQQTFLFSGTIKENLKLGAPEASEEDIQRAVQAASANDFIQSLPNRLETQLGEQGVRLSGGEKQRIAIARALLCKPKLLLLDEATSNLDPLNEKVVQKALEEVTHHRTTLIIAHRLSTAARADQIIMLSKGKIVEIGTHKQLLAHGKAYAKMYDAFSMENLDLAT